MKNKLPHVVYFNKTRRKNKNYASLHGYSMRAR